MKPRDQQRIDVLARWREGALTVAEAAALLACSQRTAWRLLGRFRTKGGQSAARRCTDGATYRR